MKKISKLDMFLFVCIVLGCVFGFAALVSGWILGEPMPLLKALTTLAFFCPVCALLGEFSTGVMVKLINNHKEKKKS